MLPAALLNSLKNVTGFDEGPFTTAHQPGAPITSVRLNPAKTFGHQYTSLNIESPVPWSSNGFYLEQRPSFTTDPLFHAGAYYVQEASSMFLEEVLKQTCDLSKPLQVLDLCAAPGGKSTLIQSLISAESLLVSNEVIKTRVNILAENITKWGAANVVVTNNDPKDFQRLPCHFDVIIVDAPCSGSGLFRKDPGAIGEWSENSVMLCSQRQQRILADVLPALKDNGVLIYSTCSYSQQEDEAIADWLVDEFQLRPVPLTVNVDSGIVETRSVKNGAAGYRFYPDKVKGEGFFIAAFKKQGEVNGATIKAPGKNKDEKLTTQERECIRPWLIDPAASYIIKIREESIALPSFMEHQLPLLRSALYIKKAGIKIGTVIRNELIPHHELALSHIIAPPVPCIDVGLNDALDYLRKEDIRPAASLKGWALIKYQGLALGWVKVLPNRINNYYPAAWRILNK